jgi:hypothetical protein
MRALVLFLTATLGLSACSGGDVSSPPPVSPGGSGGSSTGGTGVTPTPTAGSGGAPTPVAGSGGAGGTGGSGGVATPDAAPLPDPTPAPDGGPSAMPGLPGTVPGTVSVFDGTTLDGWEGNTKLWSVKEASLDGNGTTGGALLVTKMDYDDFRLVVSSRMVSNAKGGHLGICFWGGRSTPPGGYSGCKLVIPPGGGSWDYAGSGGLPGITKPMTGKFDVAQWHTTELLCHKAAGTCRMAVNGIEVLNYKEPNPARLKKGPIGVQIHAGTSNVQYKDVFIDPAPKDDKLFTVK